MENVKRKIGTEVTLITLVVIMLLTYGSFIANTITSLSEANLFEIPMEVITTALIHLAIMVIIAALVFFIEGHSKNKDKLEKQNAEEVTENV